MDRYSGNKTQRLYRCRSNYALSKLIVNNELKDLWRRENLDSWVHRYHRSSGTRSRIDRVYTDIEIANNTKINHIMVSFTDLYNAISIDRLHSKSKVRKDSWYLNNSLCCKPELDFFIKKTTTSLQQVTVGNIPNLILKRMLRHFLKIPPLKKILEFQDWKKKLRNLHRKENFKPKINTIIANKQAKGARLHANIRWELEDKKCSKTFFKALERQYARSNNI